MKKNDRLEITITDQSVTGEGIGKYRGFPFFVKDAVAGDAVRITVTKLKKSYGYGHLDEVITPSPHRCAPSCGSARVCGGCQLQEMDYAGQLAYKERVVREALVRIGHFSEEEADRAAEPVLSADDPWHYRNKSQYPVGRGADGKLICGFYAGHSHRIIPVEECMIGHPSDPELIKAVLGWMDRFGIEPYEEETGKGLVRHILLRHGAYSGEHMVCLIVNLKKGTLPHGEELVRALLSPEVSGKFAGNIVSVCISRNTSRSNVILGETYETLWETDVPEEAEGESRDGCIFDTIGKNRYKISPLSFYQVNTRQTEKLYDRAARYAALTGDEIVWDLYCGIGSIGLHMAEKAKAVYGIEVVPQAVENASENARRNGIPRAEYYCGKAEELAEKLLKKGRPDVVILDPPRKGCDRALLDTVLKAAPERIVYISCNPSTLARDLEILEGRADASDQNAGSRASYRLEAYTPADLFCQTVHVETVVLMSRAKD